MGSAVSHAAAPPPKEAAPPPPPVGLAVALPPAAPEAQTTKKVDYRNLPCPVPYEEIQREALMSLNPDLFEGLRFEFAKPLNQRFSLSHSLFMGSMEVSQQQQQQPGIVKVPAASYEFGANFIDPKLMLIGRVSPEGRVNARVKCDLTDNLILKINAVLVNQLDQSQGVFQFDYKGRDFRSQFQLANNGLYGANYIQSVTPNLSLGSEVFYLEGNRSSGVGFIGRYSTDKMVATAHVVNAGTVGLSYVQKVSEKVSLASDFTYNHIYKEVTASLGYDYLLRQCRLRGKIDTNGCVSAFLEERLNMGVCILFSGQIDHWRKDYKFGFGMTVGE